MAMFKPLGTRAHEKARKSAEKQKIKEEKRNKSRSNLAKKKKRRAIILVAVLLVLAVMTAFVIKDNHSVRVKKYTVVNEAIPSDFDGYRILQISDLKGMTFGDSQQRLIEKINSLDFDMVLFTGDYTKDKDSLDSYVFVELIESLTREVPVYFILGDGDCTEEDTLDPDNRCFMPSEDNGIAKAFRDAGAEMVYPIKRIEKGDSSIYLTGIKYYEQSFDKVDFDSDKVFSICVTHAPINYNVNKRLESVNILSLKEVDFDLAISGHTLGGTVRLPVLGAVYTKEGGLFPEERYVYGMQELDGGRKSIISSGLGRDGVFPLRLFNTPEIVIIELRSS